MVKGKIMVTIEDYWAIAYVIIITTNNMQQVYGSILQPSEKRYYLQTH